MRPIIRPDGNYHNISMALATSPGGIHPNITRPRCLALCIASEITRLNNIIVGIGGMTQTISNAIGAAIAAAVFIPVNIPGLPVIGAGVAGIGAAGVNFAGAMALVPAANRRLVENLAHYRMIQRNLQYNIGLDNYAAMPELLVGDFPYAVAAMQDARERVRLVPGGAGNAYIYSTAAGLVNIGALGAAIPYVRSFSIADINTHINNFYKDWETRANSNPSPYSNAAAELVQNLGPYCVYCEANLKTQIDVEHLLPKGKGAAPGSIQQGFSSLSKSWLNFLPSCPRCNSTKNAHPSKIEITNAVLADNLAGLGVPFVKDDLQALPGGGAIAVLAGGGDGRITDKEYQIVSQNTYQFPLEQASFQNVGFVLRSVAVGGAEVTDNTAIANQITWIIQSVDEVDKVVVVNRGAVLGVQNYRVKIDVFGGGPPIPTAPAAMNKVTRMVNICGLNTITVNNTDRRVLERTEAWFMAVGAIGRLNIDLAGIIAMGLPGVALAPIINGVYGLWRDSVVQTIKEKGFFSVWLKIFRALSVPPNPHPLAAIAGVGAPTFPLGLPAHQQVNGYVAGAPMNLAQDIATQIAIKNYFPNTNFTQVP